MRYTDELKIEAKLVNPRCISYCRVSTNNQKEDGLSIDTQKSMILKKIEEMNGTLVEDFYVDEGKTGTNMRRDGLQNMLARCTKKDINYLIVQDTSRLSRDTKDYLVIRATLKQYNVELIALSGMQSLGDDPYSGFVDVIIAAVNALHPKISGYKARQNAVEKFKTGFWPGMAPPGFDNISNPNPTCSYDKRIVVPNDNSRFFTNIFKMYVTRNHSIFSLRMYLFDNGVRGRFGKPLSYSQVDNVLKNTFYYGWMKWGGMEGGGRHTKLIDKPTFDLVQQILTEKGQYEIRRRKHDFLLRGIIFCKGCGRRYVAEYHYNKKYVSGNGKLGMYHCGGLGKRGTGCKAKYITIDDLEKLVRQEVSKLEFKPEFVDAVKNSIRKVYETKTDEIKLAKKAAYNRRDAVETKRERLEFQLTEGNISGEIFKKLNAKLDTDLLNVQKELADISKIRTIDINVIDEVLAFTRDIINKYDSVDNNHKRAYLHFFFQKILVKDKQIVDVEYTPALQVLNEAKLGILSHNWLRRQDLNLRPFP